MSAGVLSRRGFLQLGAAGLTVAVVPSLTGCALPVIPKRPQPSLQDALGWVRHVDGRTTLIIPRVEMGQNILTALKQIVCLEMGVAWDTVDAELHSTSTIARVRATVGSDSVKDFALPLAQACATLRDALASGQTQGQLTVVERPLNQLRFLQARGREQEARPPIPLEHGRAIVRGEPLYVADVRRPGMLFGRVLRAPVSPELHSRPGAMNEAAGRAVPGFVALVRDPLLTMSHSEGVGIVACTPGALDRVEQALGLAWLVDERFSQSTIDSAIDIDRRLANNPRRSHQVHDEAINTEAAWDLDLRFDIPLAAHAAIEPRAAVAEFDAQGRLQLWVGSMWWPSAWAFPRIRCRFTDSGWVAHSVARPFVRWSWKRPCWRARCGRL
jgi:isoquinoline 1-oxidoreductase beta subunit